MQLKFKPKRSIAAKMLASDTTFAFTLMTILLAYYDQEVFDEEEPEALFSRIEDDFNIRLSEEVENRINAALLVMTSDLAYTQVAAFKSVALALADGNIGSIPQGGDEELNAAEILWAITEIGLLNGESFDEVSEELSESVKIFCNNTVADEAEDMEYTEEGDELDTLEEAIQETYYQKFVTANLLALAKQLLQLEVSPSVVSELLAFYNRSMEELD